MWPHISTRSNNSAAPQQRGRWNTFLAGIAFGWTSGLLVLASGIALVIGLGLYNMTAITPHIRPVGWAIHTTMIHAVHNGARNIHAPAWFTNRQVQQGFRLYEMHCVTCHGGPGIARAQWVSGLTPAAPFLLDAARKWSPAELRFIVGKGVKMTAMPAWRLILPDRDLWSVVAFLERLSGLSQREYVAMRTAARAGTAAPDRIAHH
jgi:mono/diheme cytochrome c family protein